MNVGQLSSIHFWGFALFAVFGHFFFLWCLNFSVSEHFFLPILFCFCDNSVKTNCQNSYKTWWFQQHFWWINLFSDIIRFFSLCTQMCTELTKFLPLTYNYVALLKLAQPPLKPQKCKKCPKCPVLEAFRVSCGNYSVNMKHYWGT